MEFAPGISERTVDRLADALRASEERLSAVFDGAPDGIWLLSVTGAVVAVNEAMARMHGYTVEELLTMRIEELDTPESARKSRERLFQILAGERLTFESDHYHKDGSILPFEVSASLVVIGDEKFVIGFDREISERRVAERHRERAQRTIRERERWLNESQRIAGLGHYVYDIQADAWTGSPALHDVFGYDDAHSCDFEGWLAIVHPDDRDRLASYFTDEVVGRRTPFDIEYRVVRLSDGVERWVHGLGEVDFDDAGAPLEMFGTIQDVDERKKAEMELERRGARLEELLAERERNLERMGRSLTSIIEVVSHVVETRDPYTAGHQRRVSELAACIAREMGLPADEAEEIRVAALIHDVGKMSVPAEVLSKPGQLTPLEFELIKGHAEAGYRIIASADMAGSTAEIVYQHQERCDGSGYPRGLKGDELLQGAKVLMVADVVEAMCSHRPYRSALGIDAALEEISAGAGSRYDQRVADCCLGAFKERGFAFSEQ